MTGALLVALWASPASAQDTLEVWNELQDALLLEAADGNTEGALDALRDWHEHPGPLRSDVLYYEGRIAYEHGQLDKARTPLMECVRSTGAGKCRELLRLIELEEAAVRTTPVQWTFDAPDEHGFIAFRDGTMAVQDGALQWTVPVDRTIDILALRFDRPKPPPSTLSMTLSAERQPASLLLVLVDDRGRPYVQPGDALATNVPVDDTIELTLELAQMVPAQPNSPPLIPSRLDRLELREVTGSVAPDAQGTCVIRLDQFTAR